MDKVKKIWKKFFSLDIPVRLCIFNMMTCIGIIGAVVSLVTTVIMQIQGGQVIPMACAVLMLVFFLFLANKLKKLDLAAVLLVSIIGFVVFPFMFINGGGIYSGMPIWFTLAVVFDALLVVGKAKYIIFGTEMVVYGGLIYFEYKWPEYITYFDTEEAVLMDVGQSLIFCSVCIVLIISFQLYMYQLTLKREEKAKEEAEIARKEAEEANAAKTRFLANMSHEIRTPMGVIIGMNEMIQRETEQPGIAEYSKDVTNAARTLLSIINDILDLTKIESGKMNIVESEYQLESLIKQISDVAKVKEEGSGIAFEMKLGENLPRTLVGDELRVKECLINIIGNAFKYTEKGKIVFELYGKREEDQILLTFSVTDTGRGIKEEDMERLFESFVRLEEEQTRNIQGTGLGLNITNKLLGLMGSKLEVQSKYQVGSRFYFTLAQKIVDDTPIVINKPAPKPEEKKEKYTPSLLAPDAHVLVVDDNSINLKVFCALLKCTQIQIDTATGGMEAIEKVRAQKYDMIFLDHMMPEMDGEETFYKLKEENLIEDVPVIMLTANAIVGVKEHFLEIGFTDFLTKPIEIKRLEEVLKAYL